MDIKKLCVSRKYFPKYSIRLSYLEPFHFLIEASLKLKNTTKCCRFKPQFFNNKYIKLNANTNIILNTSIFLDVLFECVAKFYTFYNYSVPKKCPYSDCISVRMRKSMDQNNSEYGHFSRSDCYCFF